jgi:adenylate cyclase
MPNWPRIAWPRGLREGALALFVALGVLLALSALSNWPVLRNLETASLDLRFRVRGAKLPEPQTVIVLVDGTSLSRLGRWPLSRHLYAQAVRLLHRDGARIIAFDLLFPEPDETVPRRLRSAAQTALAQARDPALRQALAQLADDAPDADFAAAVHAAGNVLLPVALFRGAPAEAPALANQVYQRFEPSLTQPIFPIQPARALLPIPPLAAAAAGLGHVDVAFDDGAPRYDYLALPFAGDFVPSLPVRIAAAWLGVPWPKVKLVLGDGVQIGNRFIPTDPAMRLVVNYRGPARTIPTYSFADLIAGRLAPDLFRDRIVLIGAAFIGSSDAFPGPFGNTPIPGTERAADIVDTILSGDFIRENPPPYALVAFGLVAALAAAGGLAAAWLPTRFAVLGGAAAVLAWTAGAQWAFERGGLWLPVVAPSAALGAAAAGAVLFRYGFVDRQRRYVQAAFRHYLAPDVVNTLAAHPERLQLGGDTRMLSIMFCDIRDFTAISESFKSNPQALSRLINRGFLSPMSRLIAAHRGTIDKFMGDCVMAFWNAPLDDPAHADRACAAALAMLAELHRVNRDFAAEAAREERVFQPIQIGVGINTGECVVGNMGSDERFAYTAFGDAVNLAARLEGQTKIYGVSLIIGEATREAAPDWATLELDRIAVKGKEEAVRIYALLGDQRHAHAPEFVVLAERHAAMLTHYRARDWAAARAALERCRGRDPRLDALYDLYTGRIAYFSANPPAADWDGVFIALTK